LPSNIALNPCNDRVFAHGKWLDSLSNSKCHLVIKNKQKFRASLDTLIYKIDPIFWHKRKPSTAQSVQVWGPRIWYALPAGSSALSLVQNNTKVFHKEYSYLQSENTVFWSAIQNVPEWKISAEFWTSTKCFSKHWELFCRIHAKPIRILLCRKKATIIFPKMIRILLCRKKATILFPETIRISLCRKKATIFFPEMIRISFCSKENTQISLCRKKATIFFPELCRIKFTRVIPTWSIAKRSRIEGTGIKIIGFCFG